MVMQDPAVAKRNETMFCDAVRQIDWRERGASYAGAAPRAFVEEALDRRLAVMEDDEC